MLITEALGYEVEQRKPLRVVKLSGHAILGREWVLQVPAYLPISISIEALCV